MNGETMAISSDENRMEIVYEVSTTNFSTCDQKEKLNRTKQEQTTQKKTQFKKITPKV